MSYQLALFAESPEDAFVDAEIRCAKYAAGGKRKRELREEANQLGSQLAAERLEAMRLPEPQEDLAIVDGSYYTFDSEDTDEVQARELYRETRDEQAGRWIGIALMRRVLDAGALPESLFRYYEDALQHDFACYEDVYAEVEQAFGSEVADRMRAEIEVSK